MALLTEEAGRALVAVARRALENYFAARSDPPPDPSILHERPVGGVFATLKREGELRGCIGYLLGNVDLVELTRRAAVAAARDDPRFPPVAREELPGLRLTISVLSPPETLARPDEIVIGRDGLIVERTGRRGLLLPQVAEERCWEPERFLSETCRKGGLPPESWKDPETVVQRFEAVHFEEGPV